MPTTSSSIDPSIGQWTQIRNKPMNSTVNIFIVKLEEDTEGSCYIASGHGDPPRTLVLNNAKRFRSRTRAETALAKARKFRPFRRAEIIPVDTEQDRMVTIRMSAEQHNWIVTQANKEGVSMNTFCLRHMGLQTPFEQSTRKRGRKLVPVQSQTTTSS
jgi:hypothetical protein